MTTPDKETFTAEEMANHYDIGFQDGIKAAKVYVEQFVTPSFFLSDENVKLLIDGRFHNPLYGANQDL